MKVEVEVRVNNKPLYVCLEDVVPGTSQREIDQGVRAEVEKLCIRRWGVGTLCNISKGNFLWITSDKREEAKAEAGDRFKMTDGGILAPSE